VLVNLVDKLNDRRHALQPAEGSIRRNRGALKKV